MPLGMRLSPDGNTLLVSNDGPGHAVAAGVDPPRRGTGGQSITYTRAGLAVPGAGVSARTAAPCTRPAAATRRSTPTALPAAGLTETAAIQLTAPDPTGAAST